MKHSYAPSHAAARKGGGGILASCFVQCHSAVERVAIVYFYLRGTGGALNSDCICVFWCYLMYNREPIHSYYICIHPILSHQTSQDVEFESFQNKIIFLKSSVSQCHPLLKSHVRTLAHLALMRSSKREYQALAAPPSSWSPLITSSYLLPRGGGGPAWGGEGGGHQWGRQVSEEQSERIPSIDHSSFY